MRIDPASRRRLTAMDIELWVGRTSPGESALQADGEAVAVDDGLRIRLASGRGRWLLLIEDAGSAEDQTLLDDLRGLLGVDQVRFGRWSDSAESGVAAAEWRDRGVEWVLDFGGGPVDHPAVLNLPTLAELRASAGARKALWQALRPLLVDD